MSRIETTPSEPQSARPDKTLTSKADAHQNSHVESGVQRPMHATVESKIVLEGGPTDLANETRRRPHIDRIVSSAHAYRGRGWPVLKLVGKRALDTGWTKAKASDPMPEFDPFSNIGILLGAPASGLVGIDPDWAEMCDIVREEFRDVDCPRFGRPSALGCRHLVICKDLGPTSFVLSPAMEGDPRLPKKDDGKSKLTVGEILGTGKQTMAPPSHHPNGERLAWENNPAKIPEFDRDDLKWRIAICAVLAVARRLWPASGSEQEHECVISTARLLYEATGTRGWNPEQRLQFVNTRIAQLIDSDAVSIAGILNDNHERDNVVAHCDALKINSEARTIRKWLGITDTAQASVSADAPNRITCDQLKLLLSALNPTDYRDGDRWRSLMFASYRATAGEGKEEFVAWSTSDDSYVEQGVNISNRWDRLQSERENGVTIGTLFHEVDQAGRADLVRQVCGAERDRPIVSQGDHLSRARVFAEGCRPHARHYRDDFVDYENGRYARVADSTVKADTYNFLDGCDKRVGKGKEACIVPFQPCSKSVNETISALKADRHVLPTIDQPYWLDGRTEPDPADLISFPNGILDLRTDILQPPSPMLFTPHAVGFPYDLSAPATNEWKKFLASIYGNEQDQIEGLQEMFGYCLSSDVSQEKAFIWLGPKRSGKDTQRNVLQSLLPAGAICGPTLDSMGTNFGMSQIIGKQLAVVGDMRLGSKCDKDLLAENVLKLTGRGLFTIDRKHKEHWTGKLPCKLLLISNEMPKIKDTSGALASRFIIFNTRQSFYGREDPNLFRDKLKPELPGILLWALEGLKRIRAQGRLTEPECSRQQRLQLARDGSPVLAFVEECLTLEPTAVVQKDELYETYLDYAAANKLFAQAKNTFMQDLSSATDGKVKAGRQMEDGERTHIVRGASISLRPPARQSGYGKTSTGDIPF